MSEVKGVVSQPEPRLGACRKDSPGRKPELWAKYGVCLKEFPMVWPWLSDGREGFGN